MTTIYDIAKVAGVTATTVSYVLSGKGSVSASTRARVLKYVDELGYRPNLIARSLATRQSRTIGLIMPMVVNTFHAEMSEAVERCAYALGFRTFVSNTYGNPLRGQELVEEMASRHIDGMIALPGGIDLSVLQEVGATGLPIVYCLWNENNPQISPSVGFDFYTGTRLLADHLLGLGHRHVGIISDAQEENSKIPHSSRVRIFRETFAQAGYPIDLTQIKLADTFLPGSEQHAIELLSQPEPPTAIFATNDFMAIGVISAAWKLGLHVPRDLSVVGFDDIALAPFLAPPLTTVRIDRQYLATTALDMLLHKIDGEDVSSPALLEPQLIIRESTAPLRDNQ